jgi:hypothetical protein
MDGQGFLFYFVKNKVKKEPLCEDHTCPSILYIVVSEAKQFDFHEICYVAYIQEHLKNMKL